MGFHHGGVLTDISSLQQACHDNAEVYSNRAAAPRPLQGNAKWEIVSLIPPQKSQLTHSILSKQPTQTAKFKTLQKLILAYFHNAVHLISQLTDNDLLHTAYLEIAKVIPYIVTSRKTVKAFLTVGVGARWGTKPAKRIVVVFRNLVDSGGSRSGCCHPRHSKVR